MPPPPAGGRPFAHPRQMVVIAFDVDAEGPHARAIGRGGIVEPGDARGQLRHRLVDQLPARRRWAASRRLPRRRKAGDRAVPRRRACPGRESRLRPGSRLPAAIAAPAIRATCCVLGRRAGLVVQDRGAAVLQHDRCGRQCRVKVKSPPGAAKIALPSHFQQRLRRCRPRRSRSKSDEPARRAGKRGRHTASAALGIASSANTPSAIAISCATASSGSAPG